jgi:hypothetical protein
VVLSILKFDQLNSMTDAGKYESMYSFVILKQLTRPITTLADLINSTPEIKGTTLSA